MFKSKMDLMLHPYSISVYPCSQNNNHNIKLANSSAQVPGYPLVTSAAYTPPLEMHLTVIQLVCGRTSTVAHDCSLEVSGPYRFGELS